MNTYISQIFILIFSFTTTLVCAQKNAIEKANKLYDQYSYKDAINEYQKLIDNGYETIEVFQKIGDCYFYNTNLKEAATWYNKMFIRQKGILNGTIKLNAPKENSNIPTEYYFKASQTYKSLKQYKKADSLFKILEQKSINDSRYQRFVDQPDYLEQIKLKSGNYKIENIPQNHEGVDFAPSYYKHKIVFSSSRNNKNGKKSKWTHQPFLNLQMFTNKDTQAKETPIPFSDLLNSRLHESTTAFDSTGSVIYFTRNNLLNSKSESDSKGLIRLKIYKASLDHTSKWSKVEELPFNSNQYSVAHPALSADGKKMYFVSDMPGGFGMSDLYVIDINTDGTFGKPKNLGPNINTEGRDSFPFLSANGILYFSSDGHLGLGGFDIFSVELNNSEINVSNIGEPINSPADDITFIIDENMEKGFFASNRSGGKGADDIYRFEKLTAKKVITKTLKTPPCKRIFNGTIKDQLSGIEISKALITVKNQNQDTIYNGVTNSKGLFLLESNCDDELYEIIVNKQNYEHLKKKFPLTKQMTTHDEIITLTSNLPPKGSDLAEVLNLKPIYFSSNKASILDEITRELDKVVEFLKKNKTIKIEVGSHTDSKGSDAYNLQLSERRAASTAIYIINHGINPSRVLNKGYGETKLVNHCSNGIQCSNEEHALNRRSEFVVISNK